MNDVQTTGSHPVRSRLRRLIAPSGLLAVAVVGTVIAAPLVVETPREEIIAKLLLTGDSETAPRDRDLYADLLRSTVTRLEVSAERLGEEDLLEIARDARLAIADMAVADLDLLIAANLDLTILERRIIDLESAIAVVVRDGGRGPILEARDVLRRAETRTRQAHLTVAQHAERVLVKAGRGGNRRGAVTSFESIELMLGAFDARLRADLEDLDRLESDAFRREVREAISNLVGD